MSKYFSDAELACPCCGLLNFEQSMLDLLDEAREIAGIPFKITSACRCVKHNKEIHGSKTSSHITTMNVKGCAVDIATDSSSDRFTILDALRKVGIVRLGIASDFIHADNDITKVKNVIWTY